MGRFTNRFFKFWRETVVTRKRNPSHDLLSSFRTLIWVSHLSLQCFQNLNEIDLMVCKFSGYQSQNFFALPVSALPRTPSHVYGPLCLCVSLKKRASSNFFVAFCNEINFLRPF